MKRYVKPGQSSIPKQDAPEPQVGSGEFDVVELLEKGGEILRREIANLMIESSRGKLSSQSAKDLINYLEALSKIKTEQEKALTELSDEDLEKIK